MNSKINLNKLLFKAVSKFQKFHQTTNLTKFIPYDPDSWPPQWSTVFFKEYPRFDKIILPDPKLSNFSLKKALSERRSIRSFGKKPLSLDQISTLLHFAAGMKSHQPPWIANRFYPSGGSRYPLEVYVLSLNSDLGNVLYHYHSKMHSLEILWPVGEVNPQKLFSQKWDSNPGFVVILTAQFVRTTMKYGDRGYRYILSETGNISQNFYLVSTAMDIACTTIGYIDTKVNKLLEINGLDEGVVYSMAFGSKE